MARISPIRLVKLVGIAMLLLVGASACQLTSTLRTAGSNRQAAGVDSVGPDQDLPLLLTATPTAEVVTVQVPASSPSPKQVNDPLRFAFPTSVAVPISAWRPAQYPVPWALTPYDHFYLARPILADEVNWPQADYRYGGVFFEDIVHTGVDISAPHGTPVLASGPGKVVWAGYGFLSGSYDETDPYGIAVLIRHDFGFQGNTLYTVYGHLDRVDVVKGQRVETGSMLGISGETGKTTGPHLHFEVRLEEEGVLRTRNPELWLVPPQGWGVLAGKVMNSNGAMLGGELVEVQSKSNGQTWRAKSYNDGNIHPDNYYQENLVISDLPAGNYFIEIHHLAKIYTQEIVIQPGMVSYFTFRGRSGFTQEPLPVPGADFSP
jgi:murein DD-endopeptidase MepM/ murein hydrolase activator NlpD